MRFNNKHIKREFEKKVVIMKLTAPLNNSYYFGQFAF